ncbi:sugar ABC transporter permease [Devosia sp. ZB163]|uniref:carbohydrate ABC transporter permease n=1 Tax=Devosia sp. ZB163 TaxID=3025938 RepID=UPI002360C0ED|nr:sugar ABC transporter permease [Devosia sp. ZB163]MDC9823344.1 sugar ABC transporter permease [Devosia sp. ZB163]
MTNTSSLDSAGSRPRQFGINYHRRQTLLSFALLLPAAAAVLILIVYPLYQVVDISFRDGRVMNFAKIGELPLGLGNYARVLADPLFWRATLNSTLYVGGSVGGAFLVGLGTALLLNKELPGNRFLRTIILVPWAVPGVIVAIMFLWILDGSFGVFNAILRSTGLLQGEMPWFVDSRSAMIAVIIPTIWKTYPLITLTILAALQSIPRELYEAANVDGANKVQQFGYITWPGIQGASFLVVMISALGVFRDVDIVFATTGGGPANATETLALYVYKEAFHYFRMGTATAVGTLMICAAFAIAATLATLSRNSKF